jgi:hypothetical protein
MAQLIACARAILDLDKTGTVSETAVADKMAEVLFGPKQIWLAAKGGIVRQREAAEVVAAHVESLIVDEGGKPWSEGDPSTSQRVVDTLEAAIFRAD